MGECQRGGERGVVGGRGGGVEGEELGGFDGEVSADVSASHVNVKEDDDWVLVEGEAEASNRWDDM